MNNYEFIKKATLFDDLYMSAFFKNDKKLAKLVLEILLKKKNLKIKEVRSQEKLANVGKNKSVILDILAIDSNSNQYNIEIQTCKDKAENKRARYYSAIIDINSLAKGEKYEKLSETYVIFLCKHDFIGKGMPIYPVERMYYNINKPFEDGSHILFVNGDYKGNDDLGQLIHDFKISNPNKMHIEYIKQKSNYFKQDKGERVKMSDLSEQYLREYAQKRMKQIEKQSAKQGLKQGMKQGMKQGKLEGIIYSINNLLKNYDFNLDEAINAVGAKKYKKEIVKALAK